MYNIPLTVSKDNCRAAWSPCTPQPLRIDVLHSALTAGRSAAAMRAQAASGGSSNSSCHVLSLAQPASVQPPIAFGDLLSFNYLLPYTEACSAHITSKTPPCAHLHSNAHRGALTTLSTHEPFSSQGKHHHATSFPTHHHSKWYYPHTPYIASKSNDSTPHCNYPC